MRAFLEAALLCLVMLLGVWLMAGCGAGALERHATAASVARNVIDVAGEQIETRCPELLREAASNTALTVEQARAERDRVLRACEQAVAGYSLAYETWMLWVDVLLRVAGGGQWSAEQTMPLLGRIARAYQEMASALSTVGVAIPSLAIHGGEL